MIISTNKPNPLYDQRIFNLAGLHIIKKGTPNQNQREGNRIFLVCANQRAIPDDNRDSCASIRHNFNDKKKNQRNDLDPPEMTT